MRFRALVRHGTQLTTETLTLLPIHPLHVVIRMQASQTCYSSTGQLITTNAAQFAAVAGHGGIGIVEEVGRLVKRVKVGDQDWDVNGGIGGPFKRDSVWFWLAGRRALLANNATIFENANAYKPTEWLYFLAPGAIYSERLHMLDLSVGKIVRLAGSRRMSARVDFYNLLNRDTPVAVNNSFAAWQRPTDIVPARFAKLTLTYDF